METKKSDTSCLCPRHVAIIMDGNGRWAQSRHMPRIEGHRKGAKTVRMVVEESRRMGIRYVTLFAFSSENWQRPQDEVWALMKLFERYLASELELMKKNHIRLRIIGDRSRLSDGLLQMVERVESETKEFTGMDLILAVSYGGREEIVHAATSIAHRVADGSLLPEKINEQCFRESLYAPDVCDPDLLIRTSGECRISNFLLWQLAYSEIVISEAFWPEFSVDEYKRCIEEFQGRERRFGLTKSQLECSPSA